MKKIVTPFFLLLLFVFNACKEETPPLFTRLSENDTGITFRNLLKEEDPEFNIIFYPYFYNGGGVAVGDINNDGLTDMFFSGNMVKNRLFINQGNMEFQDITEKSHVADFEGWCTGVSFVDIDSDGWLDIYVCRSGLKNDKYRKNLLFINNHDLTFTEKAAAFGLDDLGYSTHASFFDYDRDQDLDVMLINQSLPEYSMGKIDFVQLRNQRADSTYRNKLFRNDNGMFVDVSTKAGIQSNVLSFSLGLTTSDLNMDGWPDIYIANDFKEPDYYYINNGDGTFTESLRKAIGHTALYAMGVDAADYNNDLLPDLVVLDMLAESNEAQKMHMGGDNYTQYKYLFKQGMFHQYMKNCLQKNNGDGTFSEVGQLAGISNTDWSWSPLLADFDNDGLRDLFITNGYKRDNTDIEFVVYSMNQSIRIQKGGDAVNVAEYISHMPGIHLPNYIYKNTGNDKFENKVQDWGFNHNTFSHGAAYADLDNDGDLDLITNNTDEFAGVYRNNSEKLLPENNYIRIKLVGEKGYDIGVGAKIYLHAKGQNILLEQNPTRGFQSSSDHILHAGLGQTTIVDSIRVVWPDQTSQLLTDVKANQLLTVNKKDVSLIYTKPSVQKTVFTEQASAIAFKHEENDYNDFLTQFLLPKDYSHHGPCMAKADINKDGLEDIFIGGARGQASKIFIQTHDKRFIEIKNPALEADAAFENMDAAFFDADGDGDQDLYVVSGGYSQQENLSLLQDRLYLNNGKGTFSKKAGMLPEYLANKNSIAPADIDNDGDIDIFVGGHVKSGKFPLAESSKIFLNDGKGKFSDQSDNLSADLKNAGIVNGATWADMNRDAILDLIIASEWKPLQVFINSKTKLQLDTTFLAEAGTGLWTSLLAHDFDKDGDIDIVAGNYGFNSQFKVDNNHPLTIYYNDFDGNGSVDPIITHYIGDKAYPLVPRDDMNGQMPIMKKKFNDYKVYSNATINELLTADQLKNASRGTVDNMATTYFENTGKSFTKRQLPVQAQYAPVYAMIAADYNNDGFEDLILAGNQSYNRIYLAKHDANHGQLYLGDGKGNFKYVSQYQSGLSLRNDVKKALVLNQLLIFGLNDTAVRVYEY